MKSVEVEWGKFLVLTLSMLCATALLVTGTISEAAGIGIITSCLGYVVGNGRLISKGQEPVPMLRAPSQHARRRTTDLPPPDAQ